MSSQKLMNLGNMEKLKLFLSNFVIYGIGGIVRKAIPLIMLPIITRLIPEPKYYGLNDLSDIVISFASVIAIMGMYDAMYRYFFEKDDIVYKRTICSTTLFFTLSTSAFIFLFFITFKSRISIFLFNTDDYEILVCLIAIATLIGATNGIVAAPTQMQNKSKMYLSINTSAPVLAYAVSVPLLINGYYLVALPLAGIISSFLIEIIFFLKNKEWFSPKYIDFDLLKKMLRIAIPLAPSFLSYWVFNSCDRIMISNLIGIEENGIYAIGSKLGGASQLIYSAFSGGWLYFSYSTMKEKDQVKSNSLVFEYLALIAFISCLFICSVAYEFYHYLFIGKYVNGYIVSAYLFLAPLLLMLYQVLANQFIIKETSWPCTVILSLGAIINIVFNYIFIPRLGIEGAGIATLLGYFVAVAVMALIQIKMKLLYIKWRFVLVMVYFLIYLTVWRLYFVDDIGYSFLLTIIFSGLMLYAYKKDILVFVSRIH